jgi:hypothetical protein
MVNPLRGIRPENPAEVKPEATYDPFDLANLRVDPSYIEAAGVKKLLTTVPIRNRPNPQDFVRVHPAPNYRELLPLIEFKEDREDFLVAKQMAGDLSGRVCCLSGVHRDYQAGCGVPLEVQGPRSRREDQ